MMEKAIDSLAYTKSIETASDQVRRPASRENVLAGHDPSDSALISNSRLSTVAIAESIAADNPCMSSKMVLSLY